MLILVGLAVVFGSILLGYTMHHGQIAVLMQFSEFIIIGGAAIGAMLVGNPPSAISALIKAVLGVLKGNPYKKTAYSDLLLMLHELFQTAKRDGMLAIEKHVERPEESDIFQKYPTFLNSHGAVDFLTDTMKVLLTGTVEQHDLAEVLDTDLEFREEEAMYPSKMLNTTSDALPGFGIVAAVLGIVITMSSIAGPAAEVGEKVAAALVGTFLGVLLAYGVFSPLASATAGAARGEMDYLRCMRAALLGFARGDAPLSAVEFARRSVDPSLRPTFVEIEQLIKEAKKK